MIRFKSIISRIVILYVIAVVITSILMSLALSWLLNLATNNIHNAAMEEQAASVARHLIARADGSISLELPPDLQGLYSQPYGRYSYAVVDDRGNTLFSSLRDQAPIFPADPRAAAVQFLKIRKGDAAISGASIRRVVGNKTVWVQAAEDLANRDVLIDDIVADFIKNVGCGNRYLRALFVQAAWVVLVRIKNWERYGLKSWIEAARRRLHHNVLALALANKLARIAWAVLAKGRAFELTRTDDAGVRPA